MLDMSILKPHTTLCLVCGDLRPPGSKFIDHRIEELVSFDDGCAFANWQCPSMDGWAWDRAYPVANPHRHQLPERWVQDPKAKLPVDTSALVAEILARHEVAGTLSAHLK